MQLRSQGGGVWMVMRGDRALAVANGLRPSGFVWPRSCH